MKNTMEEGLQANIASLQDQLEQLSLADSGNPLEGGTELVPEELEEEPGEDLEAIFAKLVDGEPLLSEELEALGEATAGSGELIEDLIAKLASGQPLEPDEVVLLKAALEGGGEELEAGEKIAKAIVQRSLAGISRQDAVPLLSGIAGLNRAGRLVKKRFLDWETARKDNSPVADPDLVRLFGADDSRVVKDLPASLEVMGRHVGVGDDEEDEEGAGDVLARAVAKMSEGLGLTEEEFAELSAANLQGRPLSLVADLPVHKTLTPFNRRAVPVESLQATWVEVDRMVREASRSSFLKGPPSQGRHGLRKDIVRKSLGLAIGALFQGSRV